MQVFKTFLKVLRKHLGIAALYVVLFMAVGAAMTLMDDSRQMFEQTRLDICVFDEDGTPESKALCALIGQKHDLVTLEKNDDVILDALYYERVNYVLTIKRGYGEKLAAGDTEAGISTRAIPRSTPSSSSTNMSVRCVRLSRAAIPLRMPSHMQRRHLQRKYL